MRNAATAGNCMMPNLGNFVRGGGQIVENWGTGYGAALISVLVQSNANAVAIDSLEALSKQSGVIAIRLLQTDQDRTAVTTNERALRGGDQSFNNLLMIETLDKEAAIQAVKSLPPDLQRFMQQGAEPLAYQAYSLVFHLDRREQK